MTSEFIGNSPTGGASSSHGMTNVSSATRYGAMLRSTCAVAIVALPLGPTDGWQLGDVT